MAQILSFIGQLTNIVYRLNGVLLDQGGYEDEIEAIDRELESLRSALVDYNAQDQAELDAAVPPKA